MINYFRSFLNIYLWNFTELVLSCVIPTGWKNTQAWNRPASLTLCVNALLLSYLEGTSLSIITPICGKAASAAQCGVFFHEPSTLSQTWNKRKSSLNKIKYRGELYKTCRQVNSRSADSFLIWFFIFRSTQRIAFRTSLRHL